MTEASPAVSTVQREGRAHDGGGDLCGDSVVARVVRHDDDEAASE